jgi:energy-coupling factor transporter ATP-binding protein EcfA2
MFPRRRTLVAISVIAAAVFVGARVLYRVVFGGASSGATALPSFPSIRLGGPFSHITLFGPLTLEGLALAALSAVPFATVIVATGLLVALVDPRNLIVLAPRLRIGSSVVLALGIAVSTFPVVLQSVSSARVMSALRGIRPSLKLLVPVLENTLERALGVASALESRGIRRGHTSHDTKGLQGQVSLTEFHVPGRLSSPVSWTVEPGSMVLLTGPTGQGKTTLLEALAGVLDTRGPVVSSGSVAAGVAPGDIAYVPHDPHTLFLTSRVVDDIALGLIARGHQPADARSVAGDILGANGLSDLATREPHQLSSGEAALVALVMILATTPRLVLLDEPLSALDEAHRSIFLAVLEKYHAATGATVVMTDHPRGGDIPAGWEAWQLGDQGIVPGRSLPSEHVSARVPYLRPEPDVVVWISDLSVSRGSRQVLRELECVVRRGETLLITGDNGAGKSTLLDALAMGAPGVTNSLGQQLGDLSPAARVGCVALVPSDPRSLFMTSSVADELAVADATAGVPSGFTGITCESLIPGLITHHAGTHPRDLSRGQQAAVAIAVQMSHKPAVLLLDEPTRGLDERAERAFAEVVACVVETGTAVVIAAHHRDGGSVPASRVLTLIEGALVVSNSEVTS